MTPEITQALQRLDRHLKGAQAARDELVRLIEQHEKKRQE